MLEKLEDYREDKMAKEIEALEREREYEEELVKLQREKEVKYSQYLVRQREKLAEHRVAKQSEDLKKKSEEELFKNKEVNKVKKEKKQ